MGKHSKPSRREQHKNSKTVVNKTTVKRAPSHLKETKVRKTHKKRSYQKNKKKLLFVLLELIIICLIVYSGYHIYLWYRDSSNLEQEINKISNNTNVQEINDTENVTILESDEANGNPYWDYIKMNLIDVNFSELEKTNSDVSRLDTSKWNQYQLSICPNDK